MQPVHLFFPCSVFSASGFATAELLLTKSVGFMPIKTIQFKVNQIVQIDDVMEWSTGVEVSAIKEK